MAGQTPKRDGTPEPAAFTVDTQLFRELGELLVGRDATALLELVKNSYDADAATVTVVGENTRSSLGGSIIVSDDGTGMTLAQFREGFLRLAGRSKSVGERRSVRYGRRYTGEKGVGRLATHKLARVIEVDSVPWSLATRPPRGVLARIDWREIERRRTLEDSAEAISLASYQPAGTRAWGTVISLSALRHPWSEEDIGAFIAEAEAFSPPRTLVEPETLAARMGGRLLFDAPRARDSSGKDTDPGFTIDLAGDFSLGAEHWDELIESVEWVLEIDARADGVSFAMAPTEREVQKTAGHARRESYEVVHPDPVAGPFFQARILARARGNIGSTPFRNWSSTVAGIRVYSEGFRVLPYGASDNDWLEVNRDYVARRRALRLIDANRQLAEQVQWNEDDDFALTILPSDSYVGAVFLLREDNGALQMLVNREGFVPNRAFENLKDLTRLGVDLLTRVRAAGREQKREDAKRRREAKAAERASAAEEAEEEPEPERSWTEEVRSGLDSARAQIATLRASMAAGNTTQSEQRLAELEAQSERLADAIGALLAEQRMTPVLASVGIQMAEFVHELNGLLAITNSVDTILARLREDPDNFTSAAARRTVAETHQAVRDLRARLERQASYLVDLTSPVAVRRRSRQRLFERVDRAAQLVAPALQRRAIKLTNRVGDELRTPPMFPAELTAVLLNLITNAVKAAGEEGRVNVSASKRAKDGRLILRVENTGAAVELEEAERWFRPFETTTTELDPLLGQGMGFGLPITRGILEEYGAQIHFVAPHRGYATAVQVEFPA
jgi:signal transduction histidine kinase